MSNQDRLIVAISRQVGSGGAYVGQAVARRLGIRYVDRQMLQEAARLLGVDEREVETLEDRAPSLWDRVGRAFSRGAPDSLYVPPPMPVLDQTEVAQTESRLILDVAGREDVVIVGRAASWVLRDRPGLVSVFLHAPEQWRIQRMMRTYRIADVRAAEDLVRRTDRGREAYLASITGGKWTDFLLRFQVSLDTAATGLDLVVEIIETLARSRRAALDALAQTSPPPPGRV